MFFRILALFVLVPALELYLLIRLGTVIGAAETFGLILLTGLVGSYMTKSQGLSVWRRFQQKIGSGGVPGNEIVDGVIILLSGALLITPGVLTDFVGLMGLIPATRAFIRKYVYARFLPSLNMATFRFGTTSGASAQEKRTGFRGQNGYETNDDSSGPNNGFKGSGAESRDMHIGGTPKRRASSSQDKRQ